MDWYLFRDLYVFFKNAFTKFLNWIFVNFGSNENSDG